MSDKGYRTKRVGPGRYDVLQTSDGARIGEVRREVTTWRAILYTGHGHSGMGTLSEAAHFVWLNTGEREAPAKSSAMERLRAIVLRGSESMEDATEKAEALGELESEVRADERAKEREACAAVAEELAAGWERQRAAETANMPERGRHMARAHACRDTASAIRNRK